MTKEPQQPYGYVLVLRGLAKAAIELADRPASLRVLSPAACAASTTTTFNNRQTARVVTSPKPSRRPFRARGNRAAITGFDRSQAWPMSGCRFPSQARPLAAFRMTAATGQPPPSKRLLWGSVGGLARETGFALTRAGARRAGGGSKGALPIA